MLKYSQSFYNTIQFMQEIALHPEISLSNSIQQARVAGCCVVLNTFMLLRIGIFFAVAVYISGARGCDQPDASVNNCGKHGPAVHWPCYAEGRIFADHACSHGHHSLRCVSLLALDGRQSPHALQKHAFPRCLTCMRLYYYAQS